MIQHNAVEVILQQLRLLRDEIRQLPCEDVIDATKHPNKLQKQALLSSSLLDIEKAEWSIQEYAGKNSNV